MQDYMGKKLRIMTDKELYEGRMCSCDIENGLITLENSSNKQQELLKLSDVVKVSLINNENVEEAPLKESDMYLLFYEAFNVYGPFEDQFIYFVAIQLKKFIKEISTPTVKIIVESDDVFGRIGLCFAKILLDRVEHLSVEVRCALNDLKSLKYKNAFENCGGCFDVSSEDSKIYSLIVFATNRHGGFEIGKCKSKQIIILDIPKTPKIKEFIGLGLGFIPENYQSCDRPYYYVIVVDFGSTLTSKYRLPYDPKQVMWRKAITK